WCDRLPFAARTALHLGCSPFEPPSGRVALPPVPLPWLPWRTFCPRRWPCRHPGPPLRPGERRYPALHFVVLPPSFPWQARSRKQVRPVAHIHSVSYFLLLG